MGGVCITMYNSEVLGFLKEEISNPKETKIGLNFILSLFYFDLEYIF